MHICFNGNFSLEIETVIQRLIDIKYRKHPHIKTHDFGGQADRVLI